jgi:hypothetical protein
VNGAGDLQLEPFKQPFKVLPPNGVPFGFQRLQHSKTSVVFSGSRIALLNDVSPVCNSLGQLLSLFDVKILKSHHLITEVGSMAVHQKQQLGKAPKRLRQEGRQPEDQKHRPPMIPTVK